MTASCAKSEKFVTVSDDTVGKTIRSGSFGQTRLALHQRLKRPFDVKVISKKSLAAVNHGKSTMVNEMILAPLLDHQCRRHFGFQRVCVSVHATR
jgi:serine/threonine protein kinase